MTNPLIINPMKSSDLKPQGNIWSLELRRSFQMWRSLEEWRTLGLSRPLKGSSNRRSMLIQGGDRRNCDPGFFEDRRFEFCGRTESLFAEHRLEVQEHREGGVEWQAAEVDKTTVWEMPSGGKRLTLSVAVDEGNEEKWRSTVGFTEARESVANCEETTAAVQ